MKRAIRARLQQRQQSQRRCMRLNRNQSRIFTVDDIEFPIYVIHSDNVEEIDGLLWLDDQVVDDKNMSGETLGKRRLQSPMKSIYPLKYMIEDEIGLMKHRGRNYIDTHGRIINYEKTKTLKLVYHKIRKREKKGIATVIWLKDCPFAFAEKSPPPPDVTWAGLLYDSGIPWKIYDFTKVKKKETWRKI